LRAIIVVERRKPESLTGVLGIALSSYAMSTETTDQVLDQIQSKSDTRRSRL